MSVVLPKTSPKIRKAVFPVGGMGTRFLPATKAMPKEMLTVVDRPLIDYAVEEARAAGIEEFIFVTGRGKSAIEDYFDDNYELQALLQKRGQGAVWDNLRAAMPAAGQVVYTRQSEPLGLGHAIWCARHIVGNEPFAVILADILVQSSKPAMQQLCDHYATHQPGMAIATMTISADDTKRYGIVGGRQTGAVIVANALLEKPEAAKAPSRQGIIGRYILPPSIFGVLESQQTDLGGEIQLTDAMSVLLPQTITHGVMLEGRHYDCGNKIGWLEANLAYGLARDDLRADLERILQQQHLRAA